MYSPCFCYNYRFLVIKSQQTLQLEMIRHQIVDNEDLKEDFKEFTDKVVELKGLNLLFQIVIFYKGTISNPFLNRIVE